MRDSTYASGTGLTHLQQPWGVSVIIPIFKIPHRLVMSGICLRAEPGGEGLVGSKAWLYHSLPSAQLYRSLPNAQ